MAMDAGAALCSAPVDGFGTRCGYGPPNPSPLVSLPMSLDRPT